MLHFCNFSAAFVKIEGGVLLFYLYKMTNKIIRHFIQVPRLRVFYPLNLIFPFNSLVFFFILALFYHQISASISFFAHFSFSIMHKQFSFYHFQIILLCIIHKLSIDKNFSIALYKARKVYIYADFARKSTVLHAKNA